MTNENLINFILDYNKKQSEIFISTEAITLRNEYKAKHPTKIIALKCMDGRVHLPIISNNPIGIIESFRNIGGQFDLGWSNFGSRINDLISNNNSAIVLASYHYSKSDSHLGCKGFGYNTELAKSETKKLVENFRSIFNQSQNLVYPILLGIETDTDSMILHGKDEILDSSTLLNTDQIELKQKISALFPDMPEQLVNDLLPILQGNVEYISKSSPKIEHDLNHRESILAIGNGFDWLNLYNKALINGPYGYNLGNTIEKASGILLDNLNNNRIDKEDGLTLIVSDICNKNSGTEYNLAKERVMSMANFAFSTISEKVPEALPHMSVLTGIVNTDTQYFTRIPFKF